VVGDGGVTVSRSVNVPVTTGDSYTVASAVEAMKKAAEIMTIDMSAATLAVVGATGAIEAVAAEMLAEDVPHIVLIGKRFDRLAEVKAQCEKVGADVMITVVEQRDDVFVLEGGLVEIPGPEASFNFDFGFPPKTSYACMAETIALALEGCYENYSLGKDLTVAQVKEIADSARRHGFKVAGFRSFEHAVPQEEIERIRLKAGRA
jgi:predicted amino acid dehydrogenase